MSKSRVILIAILALSAIVGSSCLSAGRGTPPAKELNIVFVGDSITEGCTLANPALEAPPVRAAEWLTTNAGRIVRFRNTGVGGMRTDDFLPVPASALWQRVARAGRELGKDPGLLVFSVMLGANDSGGYRDPKGPHPPERFHDDLTALGTAILTNFPAAVVVIHQPTGLPDAVAAAKSNWKTYAPVCSAVVAELSARFPGRVHDGDAKAWLALTGKGKSLFNDQVHPNVAGARIVGGLWARAIMTAVDGGAGRPVFARPPNFDEAKVTPYTLEDPLVFMDGTPVKSAADWARRRTEVLELFQSRMYGRMPPPSPITLETIEQGETLNGFAIRKQVRMWFRPDKTGPKIDWLLLLPKHAAAPSPAIIFLNYGGNQELLPDPEVRVTDGWLRNRRGHRADANSRNTVGRGDDPADTFPAGLLVARGFAVATACYGEISPDPRTPAEQARLAYTGVFSLWPPRDPARTDNTTALGAWAWALMRGLDMLEREPAVDARRVAVTGFSRLGKAALIAGVFDDRFAAVVPNQTGGGGAPLAKRDFGESVVLETQSFTHWFCEAYADYAANEAALPFDQHLLLACVAPRHLLVEGFDAPWFDTKGEYLACRAASPVWTALGVPGLPDVPFPSDLSTAAIGTHFGYYHRPGGHGIDPFDWTRLLDFVEAAFGPAAAAPSAACSPKR